MIFFQLEKFPGYFPFPQNYGRIVATHPYVFDFSEFLLPLSLLSSEFFI